MQQLISQLPGGVGKSASAAAPLDLLAGRYQFTKLLIDEAFNLLRLVHRVVFLQVPLTPVLAGAARLRQSGVARGLSSVVAGAGAARDSVP